MISGASATLRRDATARCAGGRTTRARATMKRAMVRRRAVSSTGNAEKDARSAVSIEIDTTTEADYTVIHIRDAPNKPGTLRVITTALADLGLNIDKAIVDAANDDRVSDCFHVTDTSGAKVTDAEDVENIRTCLAMILKTHFQSGSDVAEGPVRSTEGHRPATTAR